ncbi:hypothetical protein GGI21_001566, partial [Coemansia aciculifera]
ARKEEWRAKQREQRNIRTKAKKAALLAKREAQGLKAGDPQVEDTACVKAFMEQLVPLKAYKLRKKLRVLRCEVKTKVKKATGFEVQRITRKLKRIRTGKPKAGEHESDVPELEARLAQVKAIKQDALVECVVYRIKKQSVVIRGMLNGVVEPSEDVQRHLDDKLARHIINHLSIVNTVKKHVLDLEGVITEKNKKAYKLQKKEERKQALKDRSKHRKSAGPKDEAESGDDAGTADDQSDSDSLSSSDSGSNSDVDVDVNSDVGDDSEAESDDASCGYESTSDLDVDISDKKEERKSKKAASKSKSEIKASTFVGKLGDFVSDDALSASGSDDASSDEASSDDGDTKRKHKDSSHKSEKSKKRKGGDDFEYDEKDDADFKKLYEGVERKNRPGQRARRQKLEQIYGKEANHIKLLTKDKKLRDKPSGRHSTSNSAAPKPTAATAAAGANEQMHPSWEAKRRQKEILAQAKQVKGNKIVFD